MSKDLVIDTSAVTMQPRRLGDLEKRIFAHEQVGELAAFVPEVLILGLDARHSEAQIVNALGAVLNHHPAFTSRFEQRPGGEVWRHFDGETPLTHCGMGLLADVRHRCTAHRPVLRGRMAFADLWTARSGGISWH
ncbi:hypothetical protein ACFQFQ_24480 [Sulfitobacter porphyrae]|uniref:Uncharacterized protein n=1 Tax=Sulfitobacter porphyrae TaxID=1246864 RepID=A0ABW2B8U6_9RHOB